MRIAVHSLFHTLARPVPSRPLILSWRAMSATPTSPGEPSVKRVRVDEPAAPISVPTATEVPAATEKTVAPKQASVTKPAGRGPKSKRKRDRRPLPDPYSHGDVLYHDVLDFLGSEYTQAILSKGDDSEWTAPEGLEKMSTIELTVGAMTVGGESLSLYEGKNGEKWAIVVPFAHPKDKIKAKVIRHERFCSHADLIEIVEYCDDLRGGEGDRRVNPNAGCKYFGECGGCQLQPVPYPIQLEHKKRTVDLAYKRFSGLDAADVPTILPTIGSPKQWGYRTKITPHFEAAPKWVKNQLERNAPSTEEDAQNSNARKWECKIGFDRKGPPGVLDIEECVIATPVLNAKLIDERKRVKETIMSFKRGATVLLRDSLPAPDPLPSAEAPWDASAADDAALHVAITDHKAQVYERVGPFLFSFAAGSFFQNNNSILIPLTEYVKEAIFPPSQENGTGAQKAVRKPTHLVDTYCGSGLFGITLSGCFERVAGVEISADSITAAKRNAEANGLGDKSTWLCGKAQDIFGGLPAAGFAGSHACVVIDPPRKGCDEEFLSQLLAFKPLTAVYVSCNVHTQARDIGWFLRESRKAGAGEWWYELESLRGFDLFPQTAHVESVGVLRLVEREDGAGRPVEEENDITA